MSRLTRREFVGTLIGAAAGGATFVRPGAPHAFAAPPASYSGRTMTATSYGPPVEDVQRTATFDPFERSTAGRITLVTLYSADALARIRAEKGNPQIDLVQFSGGQEQTAATESLTQPFNPALVPNLAAVSRSVRDPQNRWVTFAAIAEGILYRTDKVSPPPTSWKDFWRPDLQGHIAFPNITNGYGLNFLVMTARINGGNETNIEPGFAALRQIAHKATIFKTAAEVSQLFAQGDVWIMPYDNANAFIARQKGLPVGFAVPKEKAVGVFLTASIVAKSRNADMANTVLDFFLTPSAQVLFAERLHYAPVVPSVRVSPDVAKDIPRVTQLLALDNAAMNAHRAQWTERWNREIAG